jgi:hypothetical protein
MSLDDGKMDGAYAHFDPNQVDYNDIRLTVNISFVLQHYRYPMATRVTYGVAYTSSILRKCSDGLLT